MKYRSRTDIISSILGTAQNGGATKTRLMYGAYLSYYQIEEYLDLLIGKQLLHLEEQSRMYKLTEKGLDFLHKCNEIGEMLTPAQQEPQTENERFVSVRS